VEVTKPESMVECYQVIDSLAAQNAALTEQINVVLESLSLNLRDSS
jgi:hypothetical protein